MPDDRLAKPASPMKKARSKGSREDPKAEMTRETLEQPTHVDDRKQLGMLGEQLVAESLVARGFTIVERNYRSRWGEIDLIAAREDTLWLVEVKTRRTRTFGRALLSARQHDRMTRMAYRFLQTHPGDHETIQLVVALVTFVGDRPEIELLEQAIEATF